MNKQSVYFVMGVSGSGKTTVGLLLAERLGGLFLDADDLHPQSNIDKMAAGQPLTDEDRWPWLTAVAETAQDHKGPGPLVIACSALKRIYREHLGAQPEALIYLKGDQALIQTRLEARNDHFMPASLLESQFATLEEPAQDEAIIVEVDGSAEEIVLAVQQRLP